MSEAVAVERGDVSNTQRQTVCHLQQHCRYSCLHVLVCVWRGMSEHICQVMYVLHLCVKLNNVYYIYCMTRCVCEFRFVHISLCMPVCVSALATCE